MKIDIIKFTQDKLLKLTKKKFSKIYITEYIIPIIDKKSVAINQSIGFSYSIKLLN